MAGVQMVHVPYRGSGPAVIGLLFLGQVRAVTVDDDEDLVDGSRMAAEDASGADSETDDVGIAVRKRQRRRRRGAAPESRDRKGASGTEVEEPHAAASISSLARSNCSALSRM